MEAYGCQKPRLSGSRRTEATCTHYSDRHHVLRELQIFEQSVIDARSTWDRGLSIPHSDRMLAFNRSFSYKYRAIPTEVGN